MTDILRFKKELICFDNKRIFITFPFFHEWLEIEGEKLLIDFALGEREEYNVGETGFTGKIISKSQNKVVFGIKYPKSNLDWDLKIVMQRGIGITVYKYSNTVATIRLINNTLK